MDDLTDPRARAAQLTCWSGPVEPEPVTGGITNTNFLVRDGGQSYFVRVGEDIPEHGVLRFNELAAARAAEAAGVSPAVVHSAPGIIVTRFIEGRTFGAEDVRDENNLARILPLVQRCHREVPKHLRGPVLIFWVFHVIRDYAATLRDGGSRCAALLSDLLARAEELESTVGPIDVVFGHNDLLAANFIDDGDRLWLVDWDYAGFNSPLFDLGGLASNNELSEAQEAWLLETYFGRAADADLRRRYQAMKCASLLREAMWSMVSEIHSTLEVDYIAYTDENLARFERAYQAFAGGA
ncbi:MAG: phosphotransferase family protein [Kiloniellales bacterium]|nr:phosphotransferase family protein [Kiloniellales bacterium]